MKIRPVGAELFHKTDGQTDTTKLVVTCRNFESAPKTACMKKETRFKLRECPLPFISLSKTITLKQSAFKIAIRLN